MKPSACRHLGTLLMLIGALDFVVAPGAAATGAGPTRSARRSAPSSAKAIAGVLVRSTGLTPSQVTVRDLCAPAPPGFERCAAQMLILRSTGAPVRPHPGSRWRAVIGPAVAKPQAAGALPQTAPSVLPPQVETPAYLQQAYDLSYLSQTRGAGDTVALVEAFDDPTAASDLATYRSYYGLPACTSGNGCFIEQYEDGGSPPPSRDPSWEGETSLDLDAVSAICPNCHILLVEADSNNSDDLYSAVQIALAGGQQVSESWGGADDSIPTGTWTKPGVQVVAAAGDNGYDGPGLADFPAAFPDVTAAGGTSLAPASNAQSPRGFSESAWSSGGYAAGSGCATFVAKPTFQTDSGCLGRSYSDLSADADPYTGLMVYDTGNGGWMQAGGTSLAAPMIAAYYAITKPAGGTAGWAYPDAWLLNDPASGSNGSCDESIWYICHAGPGYDGPTGIGSISGDVVPGAPGIGGPDSTNGYAESVGASSATLQGGVYPNGLATTYWWEYGTTTAYGQSTAPQSAGSGQLPGSWSTTVALSPATTYHYRLVAANSAGTTYGYDYSLMTAGGSPVGPKPPPVSQAAPVNLTPPQILGAAQEGQTLNASPGTWSSAGTISYQWQRDAGWGSMDIPHATARTYTLQSADLSAQIRVAVTEAGAGGQTTAISPPIGPVAIAPARIISAPQLTGSGSPSVGQSVSVVRGSYVGGSELVQFWRCKPRCRPVAAARSATTYKLQPADAGAYLVARITIRGAGSSVSGWALGEVGPVHSPQVAVATVRPARTAVVSMNAAGPLAILRSRTLGRNGGTVEFMLTVKRAPRAHQPVSAWACATSGSAPPSCTAAHGLGMRPISLTLGAPAADRVQVIAFGSGVSRTARRPRSA